MDAHPAPKRRRAGAAPLAEGREARPANAPATMAVGPEKQDTRTLRWKPLAARLAAGRTLPLLLQLMQMHPFKDATSTSTSSPVQPAAGFFTTMRGGPAWIVGTFTRRNTKLADVVPLRSSKGPLGQKRFLARYSDVQTVRQSELGAVGLFFRPLPPRARGCRFASLKFVRRQMPVTSRPAGDTQAAQTVRLLAERWELNQYSGYRNLGHHIPRCPAHRAKGLAGTLGKLPGSWRGARLRAASRSCPDETDP